ncbi:MAG: hypothetical protein F6K47_30485 [Symploca sp. SIO2E6]|nr:hypothetical protein [Symploca sp. SIO2E6]
MEQPIYAERATVIFFEGLTVDGYRMPDGSFRAGLIGASLVLGYGKDWLQRAVKPHLVNHTPTTLANLKEIGFTSHLVSIVSTTSQGNTFSDETISLDDFQCCIIYGTQSKRKAAIALNRGFTKLALIDFFRDAFGESPLTIDQKRELFYQEYASSISPECWREMDRRDIIALALTGDEPHLQYGLWNQ